MPAPGPDRHTEAESFRRMEKVAREERRRRCHANFEPGSEAQLEARMAAADEAAAGA